MFRVGAEDAEFLEKEFMPTFYANDLVNLPNYNVYVRLMIDGISSKPFSASTLPPPEKSSKSFASLIIENTREKYSTPKDVVERKIQSEWQSKEGAIREKVERRHEKGLEVLERKAPKKRKEPLRIKKDELREALDMSSEEDDKDDKEDKDDVGEGRLIAKHDLGENGK